MVSKTTKGITLAWLLAASHLTCASKKDDFDVYAKGHREPRYVFLMRSGNQKLPPSLLERLKDARLPHEERMVLYPFIAASSLLSPKDMKRMPKSIDFFFYEEPDLDKPENQQKFEELTQIYQKSFGKQATIYRVRVDDDQVKLKKLYGGN